MKLLSLLVIGILTGCAGQTQRLAFDLRPGSQAVVVIKGERATVRIRNRGPSAVHLRFQSEDGTRITNRRLNAGDSERAEHLPSIITVETLSDRRASVSVRCTGANVVKVTQAPRTAAPPALD